MKPVYEYIDYRRYLADYFREKKNTTRYFSTRYFAGKTGIKSPNFFKRVIDGKRNLTTQASEKIVSALSLSEKESIYFRHLEAFNQAKSASEKQEHYTVMISLMNQVEQYRLKADQYAFYEKWYTSAVRELICMHDFQDDFKTVASRITPSITTTQARSSVRLLLRLGMIEKLPDGAYRQTKAAIRTAPAVQSLALRQFYRQILDCAKDSIDSYDKTQRYLSGMTVGVSQACYDIIVTEIEALKDRLATIVAKDKNSEQVYQISMNVFPLSKPVTRENHRPEKES